MTIKEIASLSGFSRGTVDRVLNNRGGVCDETKKKIEEIIKESKYKPNKAGVALVRSKNPIKIGVIVNSVGNVFFDDVIKGLNIATKEFSELGTKVISICSRGYDVDEQLNNIDKMIEEDVKGIIITPIDDPKIVEKMDDCTKKGITIITLNSDVECSRKCYIGCNYFNSGQTAGLLMKLIAPEGTFIGLILGSYKIKGHRERVAGFKNIMLEDKYQYAFIIESEDDDEIAYNRTKEALKAHKVDFVYIVAAGSAGAVKAILEADKNIKIISHDVTPQIKEFIRNDAIIATIDQKPFEQGYNSIKIMYQILLENKDVVNKYHYTEISIKMKYNI
jgi:LacI family transcriptional regulator